LEQANQPYNLRDFLTVLFKNQQKILIVFFATVITVTIGTYMTSPTYQAKTSLMIKMGRENIYRPEVGNSNRVFSSNPEKTLNTEIKILTSPGLMKKLIEEIGLENIYPGMATNSKGNGNPLESGAKKFSSNISVGIAKNSDVIDIAFQHKDPKIAANALNLLVKLFQEKHIQVFRSSLSSLFDKRLKNYEIKMKESERKFEDFKQKHKIFSRDEQASFLLKQRTNLDISIREAQSRIGGIKQKIYSLKRQIRSIPKKEYLPLNTGANHYRIIDQSKAKLLGLKQKESELSRKYKSFPASDQLLSGVRNEIRLVENFLTRQENKLRENLPSGKNILYQEIKMELIKARAELKSLGAKETQIKRQRIQLDEDLVVLDQKGQDFKMLLRELTTNEKNYEIYVRKLEEANISKEMDELKMDNISIIQEATVPTNPIKPQKRLNILMSIFLGALSGIGLAFLSEYFGQTFSTPDEIRNRLGLPVIGTVSYRG
jgi:uncharacterized protein involved in exopolysaccharide biosynthesis